MKLCSRYLLLLLALVVSGCATPSSSFTSYIPFYPQADTTSDQLPPTRVVAVWAPDVVQMVGAPATQGFAGRLFFFDEKNNPLEVEGQLIVYAFDDSDAGEGSANAKNKPDRRFVFTKDQVPNHYSENKIGPSYSFWIPWQKTGEQRRTISLMPVFTTSEGLRVAGPPTRNVLPGKQPERKAVATEINHLPSADELKQVMHEVRLGQQADHDPANMQATGEFGRPTMTITMPRNMARNYTHSRATVAPTRPPLETIQRLNASSSHGTLDGGQPAQTNVALPPLPTLPPLPPMPITHAADRRWQPVLRPSALPPSRPSPTSRHFPTQ